LIFKDYTILSTDLLIPFAIKNLLNEERCFGGGQPCGLPAALAWARRPPKAGGEPTKYYRLAFRNSLHRIGIIPFLIINFLFGRRPAPKGRWPPL
jgi:hypothetical protein